MAVQRAAQLGQTILLEAFQSHESVREKILDEIVTRVISKADTVQNYFHLLSKLAKFAPQPLLNSVAKVCCPLT